MNIAVSAGRKGSQSQWRCWFVSRRVNVTRSDLSSDRGTISNLASGQMRRSLSPPPILVTNRQLDTTHCGRTTIFPIQKAIHATTHCVGIGRYDIMSIPRVRQRFVFHEVTPVSAMLCYCYCVPLDS